MMTVEVFVGGRTLTSAEEHELADRLLRALTVTEAAPDSVLDSAREYIHVLVGQPRAWATGGTAAPRYLVRVTVPGAWSSGEFAGHVVPLITDAIAATEPDPTRLRREPHCVGTLGHPTTGTEITRLMTRGFRESGERPEAPDGCTVDPVCGMTVELATARFTLTHDGVDYAFCAPGCRKVFLEDTAQRQSA